MLLGATIANSSATCRRTAFALSLSALVALMPARHRVTVASALYALPSSSLCAQGRSSSTALASPLPQQAHVARGKEGGGQDSPPAGGTPSSAAALVKVGGGKDSLFTHAELMGMGRTSLLKSLKKDDMFADDLKGVPLNQCAVFALRSASNVPTGAEEKAATELIGADTIQGVVGSISDLSAGSRVFLRVELPAVAAPPPSPLNPRYLTLKDDPSASPHIEFIGSSLLRRRLVSSARLPPCTNNVSASLCFGGGGYSLHGHRHANPADLLRA